MPFNANVIDARYGRTLSKKIDELNERSVRSFDVDVNMRAEVLDVASQVKVNGVFVNERPKADSLYNALHTDFRSCGLIQSWLHRNQIAAIRVAFYKRAPN
jgi:hypothetical protein